MTVVGTHSGVDGFTVGQRRGLGVAVGERRFVVDVDAAVAHRHDRRPRRTCCATSCSCATPVFAVEPPDRDESVLVQVRAHGEPFVGSLAR